ncbi:MAG: CotH kinase family protein, partial [Nitrososphaeraceae archaeon]
IYLDRPSENELVDNSLEIVGWALKGNMTQSTGVEHILLFDGPIMSSDTFLGEAKLGLAREDVATHFSNPSYRDSGFEIYVYTLFLENGFHELYLYAFDENGNYTLKKIKIDINNKESSISELKNLEKNLEKKLLNNKEYNFFEYIFHGKLTIKNDDKEKEYNLYVTTSDIPIVIIYTGNEDIQNNKKIDVNMQIINFDSSKKNFINSIIFDFYGKIGIELRGQTSLSFPKKQYSVEIRGINDEDKNVSLLGMPSESDWVLGAPYTDKTLMRNVLAFEISNEIGMYAPRTKFAEVFLHKSDENRIEIDYKGLYFLAERIKRSNDRVNVERMDSDEDALLTGGYILEISPRDKIEPGDSVIETGKGLKLINIYPKGDSITLKQKLWITDYINKFEQTLYSDYFNDDEFGYREYIDIDSFVDYIIISELFKNLEAFNASTFLYKERYGKLKAGPVWDFDLSTGNTYSPDNQPTGWVSLINWKKRFFKDEYFVIKYIDRWKQLRKNILSDDNIMKIIEKNKGLLSEAQIRNFTRWDILGKYVWPNPEPYSETYEEEIGKLENWLLVRADWIDNNIESLHPTNSN